MKYYRLNYQTASESVSSKRKFKSRNAAIDYAFSKFSRDTELNYEHELTNHVVEYVCSNNNRFIVSRCFA